jgi:hypothetical protein
MEVTWTLPTQNNQGITFIPSDYVRFELRCVGINTTKYSLVRFPKWNTRSYFLNLKPGQYSCILRTTDEVFGESDWSDPALGICFN